MAQRRPPAGQGDPAPLPNATGASDQLSPLTTAVNHYGTMEMDDTSTQITTSQPSAASTEEPTAGPTPIGSVPQPAVRRKIQQTTGATYPKRAPPSSEKMLSINDTIQAIEEQHSSLSKTNTSPSNELPDKTRAVAVAVAVAGAGAGGLESVSLSMKQQIEQEMKQQQMAQEPTRPYPKKVLFIIANEFCERFSYYGLRTVLVLYFKSVLGFTDSGSTVSFHLFATLCYLTPILGAILGDSILGKYKTILYLSIVYFLGELILVMSSIFWDLSMLSILVTWTGLLLIGIGTGGIKPCVAAFAGDQFLANEAKWRENFFSIFYGAINMGSLISMFLTPLLRSNYSCAGRNDCYPYAFGLPCLLIFIATVLFLVAHNYYYISPLPQENVILAFSQCTWLALKRKIQGQKLAQPNTLDQLAGHINHAILSEAEEGSPSSSRLSMASSENETKAVASSQAGQAAGKNQLVAIHYRQQQPQQPQREPPRESSTSTNGPHNRRNHWLYLAADRFDKNSIEEFRSVLGILLLFLPTPVYWCLFDQQGSLWTLQATRMDGRIFGTNLVLEPDQMMVANPLLLLTAIPIFQLVIYPTLNRCNLITTPIQRMTTGGFLAALSFVASALIEFQLQASQPQSRPLVGHANLLLVNGLNECSLANATIHFDHRLAGSQLISADGQLPIGLSGGLGPRLLAPRALNSLEPLGTRPIDSLPTSNSSPISYQLTFNLENRTNRSLANGPANRGVTLAASQNAAVGCPFDPSQKSGLTIGPLASQAVRLLYISQGNGKLAHKLFNDSLELPQANKARVRLLYEFFGSYVGAQNRTFKLSPTGTQARRPDTKELTFNLATRDGQVLLSDYLDVDVSPSGDQFLLLSSDGSLNMQKAQPATGLKLEPGTRNLLILHQLDAANVELKQELLQDNAYRISVLYQLIPYTMISMSEVMFSITGLEFSYAMAPPNLKSLILGAWSLTTAVGNILTVAVESSHPFSNIGHDFLFYAALMAADMILFAILGYRYEPYQPYNSRSRSRSKN